VPLKIVPRATLGTRAVGCRRLLYVVYLWIIDGGSLLRAGSVSLASSSGPFEELQCFISWDKRSAEDKDSTIFRNVGTCSLNTATSHLRRLGPPPISLWELQISYCGLLICDKSNTVVRKVWSMWFGMVI